jgi:hypothetical protein
MSDVLRSLRHVQPVRTRTRLGVEKTARDANCESRRGTAIHRHRECAPFESGHLDSTRERYMKMDRQSQGREIRKLMAAPNYMLGSVHAGGRRSRRRLGVSQPAGTVRERCGTSDPGRGESKEKDRSPDLRGPYGNSPGRRVEPRLRRRCVR